jgi:CRISPR-associated endoribonuclease Cas6
MIGERIVYFENSVSLMFKQAVAPRDVFQVLSRFFNYSMLRDRDLKAAHKLNEFKFYTFSAPFPFEVGKDYEANRVLIVRLRSVDPNWLTKMIEAIDATGGNDQLRVLTQQMKMHEPSDSIRILKTVNPVYVTVNGRLWMPEDDEQQLVHQLHANTEHKFRAFLAEELLHYGEALPFIDRLERLNRTPIKVAFKKGWIAGHKLLLHIRQDAYSQTLARFALGAGLGEKTSSIGGGFCILANR